MKKAIPVSLILVALSLVGFVFLQVNWVVNIVQTQEQKIIFRVFKAASEAVDSLSQSSATAMRLRDQSLTFPFNGNILPSIKVNQRFSEAEVNQIILKAMTRNEAEKYHIEYAIVFGQGSAGIPEQMTPNFAPLVQKFVTDSILRENTPNQTFPIDARQEDGYVTATEFMTVLIPDLNSQAWRSLTWILFGSALLTLITISAFYLTVRTMLQQRRLSKIKSDFINNMTHEFKTPLATISLAVDALQNQKVQGDKEKSGYFSGIIKEENRRMNKHVETILQAALMEKQELNLKKDDLHIHDLVRHLVDNFTLQLYDKSGEVVMHLNATNDLIRGDEVHINNLLNNLIDNAVKYSKSDVPPRIVITTTNSAKYLIIQVKDNGIGMSKESAKRVFEKFYRAHTGNLHNVKGFGLGMTYVKDIVEGHNGKIKVDSTLGKGTTFTVELPLA